MPDVNANRTRGGWSIDQLEAVIVSDEEKSTSVFVAADISGGQYLGYTGQKTERGSQELLHFFRDYAATF